MVGSEQGGRVIRTIVGVIVGYVLFLAASASLFLLTGRQPHDPATIDFAVVATVYGMVAALLAGLIAAWISGRPDARAAMFIAALIVLVAIISLFTIPQGGAYWSQIAALIAMAPSALVGGLFYKKLRNVFNSRPV